ncbi:MAG: hypothetical protein NTZ73_03010 [Candidatus Diapherotrites archaeon]|nr:hypothetical protein [Candidatus Diapherotrites archaeon]
MYPDEGADAAPVGGGRRGMNFNLEGLVPLIILVIIGVLSLNYFGFVEFPYLPRGDSHIQVLVIGNPSLGEKTVLDNSGDFVTYTTRDATTFYFGAEEELSQYNIVILDQSNSPAKSVTTALGKAVETYVKKGGKLIVVQNSGIYQDVGLYGLTAIDVVGWKATFGNIIPAECPLDQDTIPTCQESKAETVAGRIYRQDIDHPIMAGIQMSPPGGEMPYTMVVYPVQAAEGAKTIAFIKSEVTPKAYPAIIEKKSFPLGKVIYFNYDPGLSPGIFRNTLEYLK